MVCAECDEKGVKDGRYDWYACINGEVYGPCSSEVCYGICEPCGRCDCECHALASLSTPQPETKNG